MGEPEPVLPYELQVGRFLEARSQEVRRGIPQIGGVQDEFGNCLFM